MVNYDTILNLVSIVILLIILFIIVFGCRFRMVNSYYENFSNKDEKDDKNKKETDKTELSPFENKVLEELASGQMTTEAFTDLIKTERFTQQNLDNMIAHVEKNKGIV